MINSIKAAISKILGNSNEYSKAQSFESEGAKIDIDLQWGGYYASIEEGKEQYSLFRLLDFNQYVYHIAIYQEKFPEIPSLEDVAKLTPYIGHAPIDSKALLREREIHLLGGPVLTEEDLDGYHFYLEHHEMEKNNIDKLFQDIISFGNEPPMKVTLSLKGGELEIKER